MGVVSVGGGIAQLVDPVGHSPFRIIGIFPCVAVVVGFRD